MSDEPNRLSRWSQRKAAARRGEELPEPVDETEPTQTAALDPKPDESSAIAEAEGAPDDDMPVLPSIDELTADSDYTVFMHKKVPETLRRAALRKLWRSDPVLANLDGLNDYDEDYNVIDTAITAAQTAYKVGRGYFDEIEDKLDKVEQVLGDDSDGESKRLAANDEVPEADSANADAGNQESVSDSDAAGDNSVDASRQVASATPSRNPAHPHESGTEQDG